MNAIKLQIASMTSIFWVGCVSAISFMEAWIKFQAPGMTVELGLGVGRIVFHALNKIEWFCAIAILTSVLLTKRQIMVLENLFYIVPLILLIVQTFWLLPQLDARAELHIQHQIVPPSSLHFYYIAMEVVKVACLVLFSILMIRKF